MCKDCEKEEIKDFNPRYDKPLPPPSFNVPPEKGIWDIPPREWPLHKEYFNDYTPLERLIVADNLGINHTNVINYPDEEDLTQILEGRTKVIKFKDKAYDPKHRSGYGRKILRKNLVDCNDPRYLVNVLHLEDFQDENEALLDHTIFIIQYDFDLNNNWIELPEDSILWFIGGSFSNGNIILNDAKLYPSFVDFRLIFHNIVFKGTFAPGTTRYKDRNMSYFDGLVWKNIGTINISDTNDTPSYKSGYYGVSNKSGNLTVEDVAKFTFFNEREYPLVSFDKTDENNWCYWIIPNSNTYKYSIYNNGVKTDWLLVQQNLTIDNTDYNVYRFDLGQKDSIESQVRIVS